MIKQNPVIDVINSIVEDTENRVIPNCKTMSKEEVLTIMLIEHKRIGSFLNNIKTTSHVFMAMSMIHAMILTMINDDNVVLNNPATFYVACLENLVSNLKIAKTVILKEKAECEKCIDQDLCSDDQEGEKYQWIKPTAH